MERRLAMEQGEAAEKLALVLAELRRGMGDNEAALRALEVGFKASPQSRDLRERLEAVYREQLEYDKLAELYVTDARGRHDAQSKATRLREAAKLYREELSDPEQGAKVLREAREADPTNAELLGELVDMLTASGELKAAVDELTASIEAARRGTGAHAAPRSPRGSPRAARRERGRARRLRGGRSRSAWSICAGRSPSTSASSRCRRPVAATSNLWRQYRLRIAQLRLEMGDIEDARNVLTELLKTDSKDKATLRAIAHVDELEERWDAASATYRRLVGLEDEHGIVSAALKLAETCEKAGRLADARGGLERARMAAPDDAALRQRLAWLYEQLGAVKELAELVLEEARAAGDVAPRFEGLMRAGQLFLEHAQDPAQTQEVGVASAIAPLEEAHALRPTDLDCAALLSDAYVGARALRRGAGSVAAHHRHLQGPSRARALARSITGSRASRRSSATATPSCSTSRPRSTWTRRTASSPPSSRTSRWSSATSTSRSERSVRSRCSRSPAPLPKALAYQHLGEIAQQQGDVKRAMMLLKRAIDDDPSLQSARILLDALQAES